MALIGNYTVLAKNPGRALGGSTVSGERGSWNKSGSNRNFYVGSGIDQKVAVPNGHGPGTAWIIAQKTGGLATLRLIQSTGNVTGANLAGGLNAVSALTGTGDITSANLALVASAVAALTGLGDLTADALGKLEAAAALVGEGDLAGSVGALADAVAALTGAGTATGESVAKGSLSADINVTGDLLSTANVAAAVWDALASQFNSPGSTGAALLAAGSAGDPWITPLPGAYADGTAGHILGTILGVESAERLELALAILKNKTVTDPTTGVMTVYEADGVTPMLTANVYENAAGTQAYRGQGADRREALT